MMVTILGATGFIGSHIAALARQRGYEVYCPERDACLEGIHLGHVIYAIGLTADFRTRTHQAVEAHVTRLQYVLQRSSFDSLLYLSSTRIFARCPPNGSATEESIVPVAPTDHSDLYNLSKLLGESVALSHGPNVRVARLSNVFGTDLGSGNFLASVVRDCVTTGRVELRTSLASEKDYVSIDDVADVLLRIGPLGEEQVYHVASGANTTHAALLEELARLTGASVSVVPDSPCTRFPRIDTTRIRCEFGFEARGLVEELPALVASFRAHHERAA